MKQGNEVDPRCELSWNIYQGADLGLMNKLIKVDLKFTGRLGDNTAGPQLGHGSTTTDCHVRSTKYEKFETSALTETHILRSIDR